MIKIDWAKLFDRIERISGMPVQKMWNFCAIFTIVILALVCWDKDRNNDKLRDKIGDLREEYNARIIVILKEERNKDDVEYKDRMRYLQEKLKDVDSVSAMLDKTYQSLKR